MISLETRITLKLQEDLEVYLTWEEGKELYRCLKEVYEPSLEVAWYPWSIDPLHPSWQNDKSNPLINPLPTADDPFPLEPKVIS